MLILSLILPVLQNGGIAIIDELDNDLHPHLQEIFNLFRSEYTNPNAPTYLWLAIRLNGI